MKTKKQLKWKKPEILRSLSEEEIYNEIKNDDLHIRGFSPIPYSDNSPFINHNFMNYPWSNLNG